jgi:predicted outer membrane repeat protein
MLLRSRAQPCDPGRSGKTIMKRAIREKDSRKDENHEAVGTPRKMRPVRVAVLAVSLWAGVAQAATINVDSSLDNNAGCTLRNAVTAANDDLATGGCPAGSGDDVIDLSANSGSTITLAQGEGLGEISTVSNISIVGAGVTIDGDDSSRIFLLPAFMSDSVNIGNVTLSGGAADNGGAIYMGNGLTLEIHDSTLRDNSASGASGGGAIAAVGTLVLGGSTLFNNTATAGGGAVYGFSGSDIRMVNTTISGNSANQGGGLSSGGASLDLVHSTITGNTAPEGGALRSVNSTVTLTNSILANSAGDADCSASITTFVPSGVNLLEDRAVAHWRPRST